MFKKISIAAVALAALFVLGASSARANDWPSTNLNIVNNAYVADAAALASKVGPPKYLDVAFNTQDYIVAEGKLFYTDGVTSGSTIYAYSLPDLGLVWSQKFAKQISKIVYDGGNIYFGAGAFYSLSASNGGENWSVSAGRYNNLDYYARVYQASDGRIYGYRYYSNVYYLMVLSESAGNILFNSSLQQTDSINSVVLSDSKIYATEGHLHGGGSVLRAWDKSNFSYLGAGSGCRSTGAATVFNKEQNVVYLTGTEGAIYEYNADTLALIISYTINYNASRLVKYGNTMYSAWGKKIRSFDATNLGITINNPGDILTTQTFITDPIVVNGVLYAGLNTGQVFGFNLETKVQKYWDVNANASIRRIIYGAGNFIIQGAVNGSSTTSRIYIYSQATLGISAAPSGIEITSPYNTTGMNQYLGQTHAHVNTETQLDWTHTYRFPPTAWDVEKRYKDAGYDFVALTEHNSVLPNPAVTGLLHIENAEEDTQGSGGNHILAIGINSPIDESKSDQERINAVIAQGGVPILAHPNSKQYGLSKAELFGLVNYDAVEIVNNSLRRLNAFSVWGNGFSIDKWDSILNYGKIVFATGGDDYTPYDGGFDGAAVEVFSSSNTQPEIMSNLKSGNFYALQGSKAPRISEISVAPSSFCLTVSELSNITFVGKGGEVLKKENNIRNATYTFQGDEIYVRAEVESVETGLKAWTQAVKVAPVQEQVSTTAGTHDTTLNQAILTSNTSAPVTAKILPQSAYPAALPPLGYVSPIYQFSTSGEVLAGNKLAVSYAGKNLPVNPTNLAIFTYDENTGQWVRCESNVDEVNQIVTSQLSHYSLYTVSADIPTDTEAPVVALMLPTDLTNFSGTVDLAAAASDNQAVTAVKFAVDGREIASDIIGSDGWAAQLDISVFTDGSHKLTLSAEDFSGNRAEQNYDIIIYSGIAAPTVSVVAPTSNNYLFEPSNITGNFASQLAVSEIGIYLDGVFVAKADIDIANNTFSKLVDWSQIKEGFHKLRLELWDVEGNATSSEVGINVGQNVRAVIVSPANKEYLRSIVLPITVNATPADAAIKIYLDGSEVANNTNLDLSNLSFGHHIVEVKFNDKILATTLFTVTTSYADTMKLVKKLYAEGHIKNKGITTSIIVKLQLAELLHDLRLYGREKILLDELEKFITQQTKQKKPLIDDVAQIQVIDCQKYLLAKGNLS